MLEAQHIGEVLGGHRVFPKPITSLLELNDAVERGLPKATLRNALLPVAFDGTSGAPGFAKSVSSPWRVQQLIAERTVPPILPRDHKRHDFLA